MLPVPVDRNQLLTDALRGQQAINMAGVLSGDQYMAALGSQNLKQLQQKQQFDATLADKKDQRRVLEQYYAAQQNNWEQQQKHREDQAAALTKWRETQAAIDREKIAATQAVKQNQEVAKLSDKMSDIIPIVSSVREVDNLLLANDAGNGGDLPGIGRMESALPQWALGDQGQQMRSALASVENTILKLRSGAAVTPSELERVQNEFARVKNASEATFLQSWNRFKQTYDDVLRSVMARATPEAQAEYMERSGFDPSVMAPQVQSNMPNQPEQIQSPWEMEW